MQQFGAGPPILLLHGTGASTHSWDGLAPLLATSHRVVSVDLPGHAFSAPLPMSEVSLSGYAAEVRRLLDELALAPEVVIGHSAGAAILVRLAIDGPFRPKLVIGLNAAVLPFPGAAGHVFPALAKLLYLNPFAPRFFAWQARDPAAIARLLKSTGSCVPAKSAEIYARLFRCEAHVAATLNMMANWDLARLKRDLACLTVPLVLLAGERDTTVAPRQAREVAGLVPGAVWQSVPRLGHLMHEEEPSLIADLIRPHVEAVASRADAADG